jgi:protein SCO1/2
VVSQPSPAPNLTLTDQFDHSQSLRTFRGQPIALTFLYTHCPDVCPLIAAKLHTVKQKLGADAQRTALLAVTVDPERDTIPRLREFSEQHQLMDEWFFLTGSRPDLASVWKAYGIVAQTVDANGIPTTPRADGQDQPPSDLIEHAAPVFLIDKHGYVRALLPTDFPVDDLVTDFKVLLTEP